MLTTERVILKWCMEKRHNYNMLANYITNFDVDKEYKFIFKLISDVYNKNSDLDNIEKSILILHLTANYPKGKDVKAYIELINAICVPDIIPTTMMGDIVEKFVEKHISNRILTRLTPVLLENEFGILPSIEQDLNNFKTLVGANGADSTKLFVTIDVRQLIEREVSGNGLKWRLACLNNDIGPLYGSTLGHVFARPNTGKTTFLASEATHMISQLDQDEHIIWFHNEEDGQRVQLRVYCALLQTDKQSIIAYPEQAQQRFFELNGNKLKIFNESVIAVEDIKNILNKFKTRFVLIDVGDKILFRGISNYSSITDKLTALYGKFREIASEYQTNIITTGQADQAAQGQKWLTMGNMNNSKTGKPGELDYAIGIGMSHDPMEEKFRYITLAKNKLHNGNHGRNTVVIDTIRSLYYDV